MSSPWLLISIYFGLLPGAYTRSKGISTHHTSEVPFPLLQVFVNVRTPFDPEFSHTSLALILYQIIASNYRFSIFVPYELSLYMQPGTLPSTTGISAWAVSRSCGLEPDVVGGRSPSMSCPFFFFWWLINLARSFHPVVSSSRPTQELMLRICVRR